MNTQSLWRDISVKTKSYTSLTQDITVDVAIVGGGITGITLANALVNSGKKVAILEAHEIGGVTTAYSTGNLYIPVQPFFQKIKKAFGFEVAKSVALARKFAIDFIEKQVQTKQISCNFHRRPWYAYTINRESKLEMEVELLKQMGLDINFTKDTPFQLNYKKAVILANQARFNPLQYVLSMAEYLADNGCQIYENSRVIKYSEDKICKLETTEATVTADKLVLATHTPIGFNTTQMFTAPYRSYVVGAKLESEDYPECHIWNLDSAVHAICTHATTGKKPDLLLAAGSHHKVGQTQDASAHYKKIEKYLRNHFEIAEVTHTWSAQHYKTADHIPYIGLLNHAAKNSYIATGFFADGLIYGTIAGLIIADLILGKNYPFNAAMKSNRFKPVASTPFLLQENSNILLQYLHDMPKMQTNTYDDLQMGQGKIVEVNREKIAICRDANNQLHKVSAVCTHMKCIVSWNNAEKSWDCPCHGSRFTMQGEVIEGPAQAPLKKHL